MAILIFMAAILSGCSTHRKISRSVHDSIVYVFKDSTVLNYKDSIIWNIKDSVSITTRDSVVLTKDEYGNITSKEFWHWSDKTTDHSSIKEEKSEHSEVIDRSDSFAETKSETDKIIVEAKIPWYQRLMIDTYPVILIALIIAGLLWYFKRKTYIA